MHPIPWPVSQLKDPKKTCTFLYVLPKISRHSKQYKIPILFTPISMCYGYSLYQGPSTHNYPNFQVSSLPQRQSGLFSFFIITTLKVQWTYHVLSRSVLQQSDPITPISLGCTVGSQCPSTPDTTVCIQKTPNAHPSHPSLFPGLILG